MKRVKLRARKILRSRKRQVGEISESASRNIEKHIFRKIANFTTVARFVGTWLILILILIGGVFYQTRDLGSYYLAPQPTAGGVYTEGIIGSFTTPNPLFATSTVDLSVSKLIFSSILAYDDNGVLQPDLATSVTASDDGRVYTVKLRDNVKWHDGQTLTAADVVFTYKAIQNPDTRSPYNVSWQNIRIEAKDSTTVTFTLPSAINSFRLSLTNGILPEHLLKDLSFAQLRSADFNQAPIGTGPFVLTQAIRLDEFETIKKRQRIEFTSNKHYFKGMPKLDAYVLYALVDDKDLTDFVTRRDIDTAIFNSAPKLDQPERFITRPASLMAGTYVFFNTAQAPFNSKELRQALTYGTNVPTIVSSLGYPTSAIDGPLLANHVGYSDELHQLETDLTKAGQLLDALGWKREEGKQFRSKDGTELEIKMTTLDTNDFEKVSSALQQAWGKDLGVRLTITTLSVADLQPILLQHSYQSLLYGITLGSDPDMYAYWHSSQAIADRFNLSLYKSAQADSALEAGRTRPDVELRAAKYRPFLDAWRNDAPAVALYQPSVFFVSNQPLFGFEPRDLNGVADRFFNVHNWQVNSADLPILDI
jgi:peptide/nickel transport system substrate-binding protein